MINWKKISDSIREASLTDFTLGQTSPVAGGCTNQAWCLEGTAQVSAITNNVRYFVKLSSADKAGMFAAECDGLAALAATQTIRVPRVITQGLTEQYAFIVLEYFDLCRHGNHALLASQLAKLHHVQSTQFGWIHDNTLSLNQQHNTHSADWVCFWREQRLGYQLELAASLGYRGKIQELGRSVMDALPDLFSGYKPAPSLLHGDLWGGNYAFLADGTPILFDPAPYYGDREADIAMTELFGGFSPEFYTAYHVAYPLEPGYPQRKVLYNLYHILNHCNLFGSSYLNQAESMMRNLLANMHKT